MKRISLLVILCLCLSCASVQANDLVTTFSVVDCDGRPVANATVQISGCVDNPINVTTDSTGVAQTTYGSDTCIQYCYHIADSPCVFQVVSSPSAGSYPNKSLVLPNGTANVTPKQFICSTVGCCHPCAQNNGPAEDSCTNVLSVGSTMDFVPATASCPSTPPPAPGTDLSGQTCFAFIPALVPTSGTPDVVSVSLRDDQKNDDAHKTNLTSGSFALNQRTTPAPFVALPKNNRWGWQQMFNMPTSKIGTMYCGQNIPGGYINVTLNAGTLTFEINTPGATFKTDNVHVYADCAPYSDKSVAPGQFNCNPSKPASSCGFQQLSSSPSLGSLSSYKASLDINKIASSGTACVAGNKVFTMFHLGL